MKYFTSELWKQMNSEAMQERDYALKKWIENEKKYKDELMSSYDQEPVLIDRMISLDDLLHDGLIANFQFFQKRKTNGCKIEIATDNKKYTIVMHEVTRVIFAIDDFQWSVCCELHWGFSEFELTEGKAMRLSVLCDPKNEIVFEFESIDINEK